MPEEVELWKQFCDEASREQDPKKVLKLIDQIEAQLDAKVSCMTDAIRPL